MNLSLGQMEKTKVLIAAGVVCTILVGVFFLTSEDGWVVVVKNTPVLSGSDPVRLRIPDISVDTNFVPLGLQDNGEIEVPEGYTEVGWYIHGPTPGEVGPAVVLGHVDSYEGPGVFMYLGQLTEGDLVYIDREDGTTATFRVTTMERYDRSDFPTEKVYGNIDHAGIRLITCSGTYNRETLEYDRVLVVYGELVEEADAQ